MMRNSGKLADLGQKNKDDIDMLSADEKHAINQKLWAEMDYPIQYTTGFTEKPEPEHEDEEGVVSILANAEKVANNF